jgi:transketolase
MTDLHSHVHAQNLVRFGREHPDVVVLSADLTSSTEAEAFRSAYPDRFYSMGMAEQNMMSVAGGLAREGLVPLVHDFAVFMYRRALDQIEMSIAYPNLPVKMLGFLPGLTTPGGVSHQAINDLAVMTALPNVRVLECADATDVESVLEIAYAIDGPVYVRMLRGALPRLFSEPMRYRQARVLASGGTDVVVLSSGVCTIEAIRAVHALAENGAGITHLQAGTLKPFDDPTVLEAIRRARHGVVTVENHLIAGGLGSATAVLMAENGIGTRLVRLGLRDTYAHGASQAYLLAEYGLDTHAIVEAVGRLLGREPVAEPEITASPRWDGSDSPDEDL